jgi:tetratricopeptide (TPR) repeat protein
MNNLPEALVCLSNTIKINPKHVDAYINLGNVLFHMRRFEDAQTCYDQAIFLDRGNANAYFNKSSSLLSHKEFKNGFELYNYRWNSEMNKSKYLKTDLPLFCKGEVYDSVLLWGDQGLGDTVLFLSLIEKMYERSRRITIACDCRLIDLLSRSFTNVTVVDIKIFERGELSEKFDAHAPISDLGYLLEIDFLAVKNTRRPYLFPKKDVYFSDNFRPLKPKKVITCGIAWKSSASGIGDAKSLSLIDLKPLLGLENFHFINLQYGDVKAEISQARECFGVNISEIEDLDIFSDIDGLVALISQCDIVVTSSNITAHLVGALGKKAAVLVPHGRGKIWYWHHDDVQSFWYPNLRVFYQQEVFNWSSAVEDCAEWLKESYG